MPSGVGSVKNIRSGVLSNGQLRVVLDLNENVRSRSFTAGPNPQYGDRLVIELERNSRRTKTVTGIGYVETVDILRVFSD